MNRWQRERLKKHQSNYPCSKPIGEIWITPVSLIDKFKKQNRQGGCAWYGIRGAAIFHSFRQRRFDVTGIDPIQSKMKD